MLQPALLGGVVIGVLSALPIINLANCCCAWILFGGGLSAYLMQQQQPAPITLGDGALVGLVAGALGSVIWTVVAIPLNMAVMPAGLLEQAISNAGDMPEVRTFLESLRRGPVLGVAAVIGFTLQLLVCSTFGMIGGLFGALFFRKSPPPPPPDPVGPPPFMPPPLPPAEPPSIDGGGSRLS